MVVVVLCGTAFPPQNREKWPSVVPSDPSSACFDVVDVAAERRHPDERSTQT
jgi:hypothetical protein